MGEIPCGFLRAAAVYCSTKTYSKNTNFEKEGKQTVDTILWIIAIIVCAVIACFGGYMYRKSMI